GFYTTRDFEDILAFAAERHIDVIPEIDVPGHARAAVQAMEFRARKLGNSARASQFRLFDPDDTSKHTSVQGYTDNFLNPCLDSTYAFLSTVAREIAARYRAAGAPLVVLRREPRTLPPRGCAALRDPRRRRRAAGPVRQRVVAGLADLPDQRRDP